MLVTIFATSTQEISQMKLYKGHFITKAIIILMTVFVWMPCTVKSEIKQAFDIPYSAVENSSKPNKTAVCQSYTNEENRRLSVSSFQKNLQRLQEFSVVALQPNATLQHNYVTVSGKDIFLSVPIYILHEQYLI